MRGILVGVCILLLAASTLAADAPPPGRVEIKLSHKGKVFGEGPEWDKQFASEALQIFKDLKPDPDWVAKLRGLPDNSWLKCSPVGDQGDGPAGRSEVPMVYMPDFHACMFHGGCGDPGYSSDTWAYHLGANRWVQMQPNFVKCAEAARYNREPPPRYRPFTRCSLGLTYDSDRKVAVLRGGANSADGQTWAWDPATNQWKAEADARSGCDRREDNCLGFVPGLGVVEIGGGTKDAAQTWIYDGAAHAWKTTATKDAPLPAHNSKLVWASKRGKLIYWAGNRLWAFDPKASTWEDISPKEGPSPAGFYRQGIDYDSANDVVIMYGSKDESGKMSMGPWVYSFEKRTWTDMKPAGAPPKGSGQCLMTAYDSEYNVLVIACNGRGTWVYRYKQAAAHPATR